MKSFKWVTVLVVLAVVLAGGYWLYQRLTSPAEEEARQTAVVQRGNLVVTAAAFGSISLPQKVRLSFPVSGILTEVGVEMGDEVEAGQVLARLDEGPLRQAVLQAQVALANAKLALKKVKEPYSEDDIARQEAAVAEAERALGLARQDVPIVQAAGEKSVADAQEALDKAEAPFSQDEITAATEAVAEAQRALELARKEVPVAQTTGEKSVASAQEALDKELDSYGAVMLHYLGRELSDQELLVDPNVYFFWVTELPKPLEDAYQDLLKVKENLDLARLQADKSLQAARNGVTKAEEALRQAQVRLADMTPDPQEVDRARRNLELARLQADKSLKAAQNAVARAEESLQAARGLLAEMRAGADPEEIAPKELQVSQARLSLEEAEADLEASRLVAPFSGVVAEVMAEAGDRIATGAPVVVLVDPSRVEVSATVDEVDVARVRVGQPAVVTLDALPGERLRGRVVSISPVAQIQQGVVSYPVVISVLRGGEAAREGMSASARIVVEMKRDVLLVPSRAVRSMAPGQMVSVETHQGVQLILVEVGASDGRNTEIVSGLKEGETVVLPASSTATPRPFGRGFGGGRLFR